MPSGYSHFDPCRTANRLRAGDFISQAGTTGNASRREQPTAGCEADGASAANHDAVAPRDE
jgi:hypothetical protein